VSRSTVPVVFAAVLLGSAAAARQPAAVKPVSFAILEDYDKGDDLDDVERDFALFRELEIDTWRGSFGWDDYEPKPGGYDFEWLHRFAERAARHRIRLRPYIGYTPEWAARRGGADREAWNNPPADVGRRERFARELARAMRRHPNVASYEIYNEENVTQWWEGDAAAYARVLVSGSRAIRATGGAARILFGGLVFPDAEWIEAVCGTRGAPGSFDVLPFHAYPETWTPPGVTVENYLGGLSAFVSVADRTCGRKPIWINETGFATVPGVTERAQAAWWVRAVATFLAHPRVEHIGVYEIKDLPSDRPAIGDAPNYHLGLTRADRTKKLAFRTVDLLTDLLDTGTIRPLDDVRVQAPGAGESIHVHLFERPDGDRVLFVWAAARADDVAVSVGLSTSRATEFGLDGRPVARAPIENGMLRDLDLEAGEPRIFRLSR
jgi:hypothetical protein